MDYKEVINNTFIQKDDSVYDGIKNGIILAKHLLLNSNIEMI